MLVLCYCRQGAFVKLDLRSAASGHLIVWDVQIWVCNRYFYYVGFTQLLEEYVIHDF